MILKLENTTTHQTYEYSVDDMNNGEKLYFRFNINTLSLDDGEYNLTLLDGDKVVCTDILKIGDFNPSTLQYKRGENTYIAIELDAKIESKNAQISDVSTVIYPNAGYDGMDSVIIDAQPLYDIAFEEGNVIGYDTGKQVQKELLEPVTITENGVYSREDGYNTVVVNVEDTNGSYDEGYQAGIDYASENAEEIAAANAIDLVATEFGTYYTKYSDNIDIVYPDLVTGIYPNGENFYNYANLANSVYNTGIIPTKDCKIEFWHKYTNSQSDTYWKIFIGSGKEESGNNYQLRRELNTTSFWINWGDKIAFPDIVYGEWNHIVISYLDGIVVNGVKISEIGMPQNDGNSPFYINGAEYSLSTNINGYFGMIKITAGGVENVIIPTEDGFKNITTGEMLEMVNDGVYAFVNNTPNTNILDNLIKSVDVQPKIDVGRYGIKFANSTFSEVPPFFNFNNLDDCSNLFQNCGSLQTIPQLDTRITTNMESMFQNCGSLQTIPQLDTSNVTNMKQLFYQSPNFISIPPLNAGKITFDNYSGLFYFTTMNKLTDFGGLIGFKGNANNDYTFVRCPNLTYQSCINILNGLYDFVGNGETPTSSQGKLKVHHNFLTTVGDEITIATNKGWNVIS